MLINLPDASRINSDSVPHADLCGIVHVINDLFQRDAEGEFTPPRFGDAATRTELKRRVDAIATPQKIQDGMFFEEFTAVCRDLRISPFKGLSIAIVGAYDQQTPKGQPPRSTIAPAKAVLEQFKPCYDIAKEGPYKCLLTTETAPRFDKVDYVLTCNVVNAPDNPVKHDTMLACSMLTKAGGRVLHLVGYGYSNKDRYDHTVSRAKLHEFAGQKHIYNLPAGPYSMYSTEVVGLRQENEVSLSPQDVDRISRFLFPGAPRKNPRIAEAAPGPMGR